MAKAPGPGVRDVKGGLSVPSLAALDAINFFLAAAQSGFGPYVASFFVELSWTPQNIGFALTAATVAGLLAQMPSGELLDTIHSKRLAMTVAAAMILAAGLAMALWPSFPAAVAALMLQAMAEWILSTRHCVGQPWPCWA